MKTLTNHFFRLLVFVFTVTLAAGCTLGDVSENMDQDQLDAEEIEAASQIMGQALSDDNDGVFASLNDALTDISSSDFRANARFKSGPENGNGHHGNGNGHGHSGRGNENDYEYSYDPVTGIHSISFDRSIDTENFQKTVSAQMTYIFTDDSGEFIEQPRENYELVENIDFTSLKTGTMTSLYKESEFSRADTFAITGVSDATPVMTIDGKHYGNGFYSGVRGNGNTFERNYVNEINFLDIQIDKALVDENGSLQEGVTGVLNYEMTLYKNNNGDESTKNITGTIEMDGDGTALLRFKNFTKLFEVDLGTGFVSDNEAEEEGIVDSVDVENGKVILDNGTLISVNERTEIEGDDGLVTLADVASAIAAGFVVEAEAEGYHNPQNRNELIADKIEFETDDDGFDEDEDEEENDDDEEDDEDEDEEDDDQDDDQNDDD
ncbi:hypothetical protein [Gracilimonas mengyeensis]|nr:hypothetical protein [Gracilimonas mengyeensis]